MSSDLTMRCCENASSTLLYFSEDARSEHQLCEYLTRQGFHLEVVESAQEAANRLFHDADADAVVIHQDHIDTGSMMSLAFKLICPQMPVILLSAEPPLGSGTPMGVDAMCYGDVGDDEAAHRLADAIRQLLGTTGKTGQTTPAIASVALN